MANPRLRFRQVDGSEYPDWKATTLKQLGRTKSGTGFPDRYQGCKDLPIPFYKVSDMTLPGNETTMNTANNYVSAEILTELKANPINADAIIFAKVGAALLLERKRIAQPPFVIDNNMMAYIPQDAQFLPPFAYQWFLNQRVSQLTQKGALPSINGNDVNDIKISIPSLEEQAKIAAFLSAVDDVIAATSREIADLELLKRGAMQRIFSRKVRFCRDDGSAYPRWKTTTLSKVVTLKKGQQIPKDAISETGRYEHMNGGTTASGRTDLANTEANTISISEGGNSCGHVRWNAEPFYSGGHNYTLRDITNETTAPYLYQYLKNQEAAIMRLRVGSGLPNIQAHALRRFPVLLPCLEEQAKIAEFLTAMDNAIAKAKEELDLWQLLKKGLAQQMFA